MMKKKAPLEKSRPDSAISAKMFLSAHRLTLQVRAGEPQSKVSTCKTKLISFQGGTVDYFFFPFYPTTLVPCPTEEQGYM